VLSAILTIICLPIVSIIDFRKKCKAIKDWSASMIYGEFMGQMDTVAQTYGLRNKEMALLTCILNSFIDYLWCLLILLSFTVLWILHLTGVHEIGNFTKSYFRFTIHVFCISIVSLIIASFIIWAKPYNTPALNVAH